MKASLLCMRKKKFSGLQNKYSVTTQHATCMSVGMEMPGD